MKWSNKEKQKVIEMNRGNYTDFEIARELNLVFGTNRSVSSVQHQRKEILNLEAPLKKPKSNGDTGINFLQNNRIDIVKVLKKNIFKRQNLATLLKPSEHKQSEKVVLLLSDMHSGMVNKIFDKESGHAMVTYDDKIRQQEIVYLRNSILRIKTLMSGFYNLDHLIIFNLGDNITNDRMYGGQAFNITKCVGLQILDTVRDLTFFMNEMKKIFSKITFVGVTGNHGRSQDDSNYDEPTENNYEFLMYKMIESIFIDDKRVEIIIPNTKFYMHKIYNHKYLLTHGDKIRGYTRNSVERSIKDYVIANDCDFDVFVMGHLHRLDRLTLSEKSIALINGSWISKDNYGFTVCKQYSKPQQWLFGVSKKRAITWDFIIDLKEV